MAFNPALHQVFMMVLRDNETDFSEKVNRLTVMYQTLNVYNKIADAYDIVIRYFEDSKLFVHMLEYIVQEGIKNFDERALRKYFKTQPLSANEKMMMPLIYVSSYEILICEYIREHLRAFR